MLAALGMACLFAGSAKASYYRMVLCAANNGSNGFQTATNTASSQNPGGIFSFENYCGPASFPAGSNAFLRIAENQADGYAAQNAYGSMSWTIPPWVEIVAGGGYTREPNAFNDGWRGRYWLEGLDGSTNNVLMQGSGVQNGSCGGVCWAPTSVFASHLWPFGGFGRYRRFVFELTCMRQAGCDRSNFNAVDSNSMILTLDDVSPSHINFTNTGSGFLSGAWVRGSQNVTYDVFDQGSGLRFERMRVDGAERSSIDWRGNCDLDSNGGVGEFARNFRPCPEGGTSRSLALDTASLPDGSHSLQVCSQDYGQAAGLNGTGGESCDSRTIRVDNNPPAAPAGLTISTQNPNRYLDHFGARWTLAPDAGSPITRVHYAIVNAAGAVVVPEQVISASNPTQLSTIAGPKAAGDYRLRVWLEDAIGFTGPVATVAIPHDTTPPAAPQGLTVAAAPGRWADKMDLKWTNMVDAGAPIDKARFRFLDASGQPVGAVQTIGGANPESIEGISAPSKRGDLKVAVWLSDAEGNVGAPATVSLPIDTTPPAAPQLVQVVAPETQRSDQGFDVRWQNIADTGSPIDHASYQVLDGAGNVVVGTHELSGENPQAISDLDAPRGAGAYTLKIWLTDAEGNVGAPAEAPLSYSCSRSDAPGGEKLSAGIGDRLDSTLMVRQDQASSIGGSLAGAAGPVSGAAICVFSRVTTDAELEFLGTALTGKGGSYRFPLAAGSSREIITRYRDGHRQIEAQATVLAQIEPTLNLRKRVVRNKRKAIFYGEIPGPHNDNVTIVLQVKSGKGWRAFRRYRTREGGHYEVGYRFTQTSRPTTYVMRAQVRRTVGLPYEPGNSREVKLRVLP
ncbi:MAG TPA: hypothetical protein VFJ61_06545 [Solirubrobacterales bacterium]|nr:hypothetical protein [Solirubrobacterales bacterium]